MAVAEERSEVQRESLAKKIWSVGVRHVVFMALGAALYAGLSYATNSLALPGASNVSLRPGIVIPLFFGAVFGPWVGLFTGLVGNSISDAFSYGIYWNWEIGIGLVGFIPGLVMYFTRGRYNSVVRVGLAVAFSIVGLLVGLGFAALVDAFTSGGSPVTTLTAEFVPAFLTDTVFAIVLLPILLSAYNAALGRAGRS